MPVTTKLARELNQGDYLRPNSDYPAGVLVESKQLIRVEGVLAWRVNYVAPLLDGGGHEERRLGYDERVEVIVP